MRFKKTGSTLIALLLLAGLSACGNAQPQPEQTSTSTSQTATSTATVRVEGDGVATDVTVSVIDPDTGLEPTQGAEGLEGGSAAPTDSGQSVGDSKAQTDGNKNVTLPFSESYELTAGQKLTVAAQNGTADSTITVTISLDGVTTTQSASGANVAVAATSGEVR